MIIILLFIMKDQLLPEVQGQVADDEDDDGEGYGFCGCARSDILT